MASSGQIRWKPLKKHMDNLLPGWSEQVGDHRRGVRFGGKTSWLPLGPHGSSNPEIELGHVKKMFRHFGRLSEARQRIQQLR